MPLKPSETRNLSVDELKTKYNALMQELFSLRQQARAGKLEKPDKIRQTKKDIARILTILTEKEIKI
ncbi:MAG: 50S ribosomal protein L29 [Omnitrophica WOR_2 bacterium SM23_29]|nr:MAG: 50S ribosomal protein L29 [Omnitrophica WOR_2 bacterium SM23_29]